MHKFIMLTAAFALAGCSQEGAADPLNENDVAAANTIDNAAANTVAPTALASLNETTWEFIDPKTKKPMQESIDASGKYIVNSGKEHIDHGTAVVKNGKSCFTSAMKKDGEECWTDPALAIDQSGVATSDKGEKLTIRRTEYVPLTM
jgi:PBP1b-binding outer membrane lipoprotein LpoB